MKKLFSIMAITVLLVSTMGVTAFARGGHGSRSGCHNRTGTQPQHELCTVADCETLGAHEHDGTWYCNQSGQSGDYAACTVSGCTELGLHEHDGEYYLCRSHGMGQGCAKTTNR